MKEIPKKNYIYVVVLLVMTVLIVFSLSNIYVSKNKFVSEFYEYSNVITSDEFNDFIFENPDSIIYISDKYDLSFAEFESELKNKIESLNIKNNFVYIDKESVNESFINDLEKNHQVKIFYDEKPIVLFVVDKEIIKVVEIGIDTSVETLINYEVFE